MGWLLAVLAAVCIGMAKAGFGGLGMLAILVMARVLPPRESTGAILPMLILADVFAISIYHQHARGGLVSEDDPSRPRWHHLRAVADAAHSFPEVLNLLLAPGVVAGIFSGRWLLGMINQSLFEWLMILFSLAGPCD
jgi:uncharacterized membrane protein YfcA